jgi:hypothetical protein
MKRAGCWVVLPSLVVVSGGIYSTFRLALVPKGEGGWSGAAFKAVSSLIAIPEIGSAI